MGFKDIGLIMDRGLYSEANINDLYKEQFKLLVATKTSLKFVREKIDLVHNNIRSYQNYDQDYSLYSFAVSATWDYKELALNKDETIKDKKPIYIHIYFNSNKAADEEQNLDVKLATLSNELLTDKRVKKHEKLYEKYFDVTKDENGLINIMAKEAVIMKTKRYYGYFALLSN
jgi:hypothetical protein